MLLHISQHKSSEGLQVATQVLYSIALGPLLSATLSFLNPTQPAKSTAPDHSQQSLGPKNAFISRILRLVHILIIVAIALGITGGLNRAPHSDGTPGDKYDDGATELKVSSILLLVAFLGICAGTAFFFPSRSSLPVQQKTIIVYIVAALPLLLLRVIYSLLSSFNLSTTKQKKTDTWNMFTGSVAAYVVMAMLTQIGVVVLYTVGGYGTRGKVTGNMWGLRRSGTGRMQEYEAGQEGYRMADTRKQNVVNLARAS